MNGETIIANSSGQACAGDALQLAPQRGSEEMIAPAPTPIGRHGAEAVEPERPEKATSSPIDPPGSPDVLSPAPLAVPEASDDVSTSSESPVEASGEPPAEPSVGASSRVPAFTEPPAADVVGDRYATENELFGSPPPTASSPSAPAVEPAAEKPQGNDPAVDPEVLDLFGDPISKPAAAADPDTAPSATDEESPAAEDPAPGDSQTDVIEPKPEAQPEPGEADIFGAVESRVSDRPSGKPSDPGHSDPVESDEAHGDDSFGAAVSRFGERSSVLAAAGGLQSEVDRIWRDNTAKFQCPARLVQVTTKSVILRRSKGADLSVPFARLSQIDLQFVHQQVVAVREARGRDTAADELAVAGNR